MEKLRRFQNGKRATQGNPDGIKQGRIVNSEKKIRPIRHRHWPSMPHHAPLDGLRQRGSAAGKIASKMTLFIGGGRNSMALRAGRHAAPKRQIFCRLPCRRRAQKKLRIRDEKKLAPGLKLSQISNVLAGFLGRKCVRLNNLSKSIDHRVGKIPNIREWPLFRIAISVNVASASGQQRLLR
ncbi:hypothetical protein RCH09_001633 [Actimicrobium sp. GrIS 1.19]|uniref:hypothetical protein n=1 Tax=Actimicrobium sp. GrIS 1.19 TaxID=3071708 RepID=UPI002DFEE8B0|nr:hypothetical protein [Actimicrobium sp. GrIS 1.19]